MDPLHVPARNARIARWPRCLAAVITSCVVAAVLAAATEGGKEPNVPAASWQRLDEGLDYTEVKLSQRSSEGDSIARIVRADPARFGLRLLNASATADGVPRTARDWAQSADAVAVTNAAMFQADGSTSVSLMVTRDHVNNGHVSKDRAVLAFDRRSDAVPAVQIIDRTCQDLEQLRSSYGSFVQSIRMISCSRQNVWTQQEASWSTALVATDHAGRVLLIHVRSPYTTHDLIENLLALPIAIEQAMYLEGGRPAQLYLRAGDREVEVVGSTSSTGLTGNRVALPFPNALALYRLNATAP
jgi:hypothetical protein